MTFSVSRMRRQRGVTLIELVVAVSITAVITLGLLFALRTSVTAYEKTGDRLRANREQMGRNQILARELGGIMPVTNQCGGYQMPFLLGTSESLRVVSSYSIAEGARGYPQILDFRVGRSPSGAACSWSWWRHPYTGPGSSGSAFCGSTAENAVRFPGRGSPPFRPGRRPGRMRASPIKPPRPIL